MVSSRKPIYLLAAVAGIFFLPYIGAWIDHEGKIPNSFFDFPALRLYQPKAGFDLLIFCVTALIFGYVLLVYLFPAIAGFKKVELPAKQQPEKVSLPIWFWIGLAMWGTTLIVLWGKFNHPRWLVYWAALPLFWGLTLVLDGWVYVRNSGKSLISQSVQELIGIGTASISGWLIFEYLNFFVEDNWLYPFGNLIHENEFTLYAILGSSGLMPMAFELYYLLQTSRIFKHRFCRGPVIRMGKSAENIVLFFCFTTLFGVGFFPDLLFGTLWISPLCILLVVLKKLNIWTPFTPIRQGDWTSAMLFNVTYLFIGFSTECMNYYSAYHLDDGRLKTHNPDYWTYSVPYVDVLHVFEMPLLGFLGYLPFGLYCAVWWITFCTMLNIPSQLVMTDANDEIQ